MRSATNLFRRGLGEKRLLSFLRWSPQTMQGPVEILACTLVNQHLDAGRTLDDLFGSKSPNSYQLKTDILAAHTYLIEFGCHAGPEAGDGGTWEVVFTKEGDVQEGKLTSHWVS